jgi:RNA polymerase sigma-70 factor (ECF subfamily)
MADATQTIESLYKSLSGQLRQFITGRVSDPAQAEDILQDVFLKIHSKIDTLQDQEKLESWVFQITRNAIIDYYRGRKQTVEVDEALDLPEQAPSDQDAVMRLLPSVREFVEQLPEPYRQALRMVEYEGVSQKELAERLGISFSGAKSRVQRGRAMLRDLLMQCCHFEFDRYGTIIDYHPIRCACCPSDSRQA